MTDNFEKLSQSLDGPVSRCLRLSTSDTQDMPFVTRLVYVSGTSDGILSFIDANGNTTVNYPVAVNSYHPIRIKRLLTTTTPGLSVFGWE